MAPLEGVRVTTAILWRGAVLFALVDAALLAALARRLTPSGFRELRGTVLVLTAVFWFCLWLFVGSIMFWDRVYGYVFPAGLRWWLPPGQAALTAAVAVVAIALATRLPGWPVVTYCLLGGAWGALAHTWGVFLGLMDKPPMLHGASPAAAVVLAFFEFTFYFCVVVVAASLVHRLRRSSVPA